jgi:hypothetical protein
LDIPEEKKMCPKTGNPLEAAFRQAIFESDVLFTDDTPLPLQDRVKGNRFIYCTKCLSDLSGRHFFTIVGFLYTVLPVSRKRLTNPS